MKTGRKQKHHTDSKTGLPVIGLTRRPDGRWRIIGTQTTFTEHDEQQAIERFRNLKTHGLTAQDIADIGPITYVGSPAFAIIHGFHLTKAPDAEKRMWKWIGEEIRKAPLLRARMTGIEEIGYFKKVKPAKALPTFKALEQIWKDHYAKSKEQKRRVLHAWADFKKATGVVVLDDITPEVCIAYRDAIYARQITGKMQSNIFTRIRRLFTFAKSRAVAIKELGTVIENLKLLVPNESGTSLDPQPIELADWKQLLATAEGDDRAMILLMLNGAFYVQEVIRLKWSEIKDNCIVTHRNKEGRMIRVCVLWRETLDALKKVKKSGEFIFYNYAGKPLGPKGADKRFRKLRDHAKIKVTSSQLRDGAATAAAQANVNERLLNLLLGHRSGMNDHYVKRNPKMCIPACEAVHSHYFPKGQSLRKDGAVTMRDRNRETP